ncbi:MAG: hypothetical protein SFU87_20830 [Chitinophagaceae bacterium]|nr:hypothetical protein [Chitinophagaceae bacterium]
MSFFKSLFFRKKNDNDFQEIFSPDFEVQVEKAIKLLSENEADLNNETIFKLFTDNGIGEKEAIEILLFLPISFIRHWIPNLKWPDTYDELINGKQQIEKKYAETKSFLIIWEVTSKYFQNSPDAKTILQIGGRSAEFHTINQLLNEGGELENVELAKTTIMR